MPIHNPTGIAEACGLEDAENAGRGVSEKGVFSAVQEKQMIERRIYAAFNEDGIDVYQAFHRKIVDAAVRRQRLCDTQFIAAVQWVEGGYHHQSVGSASCSFIE